MRRRHAASVPLVLALFTGSAIAACSGADATFFGSDAGDDGAHDDGTAPLDGAEEDGGGGDATVLDGGGAIDSASDTSSDATIDTTLDASDAADVGDGAPGDVAVDTFVPFDSGDSGLDCAPLGPDGEPRELGCTGLYSDWTNRVVASELRYFDPGIHLWSDGAAKKRWMYLPPGTQIDTSDMNEWVFPVGTKFWKEFRLGGARIETRLLWKKSASQWVRTTYVWSQDESSATELLTGQLNVADAGYEIPTQDDCTTCHEGHVDGVLGFEAIGLSTPQASGETMQQLVTDNLVTQAPSAPIVIPGNATEVAALGWLHANCGNACHSSSPHAYANFISLRMRLRTDQLGSVQATDTYTTAVNVPSDFPPDAGFDRIRPHDVDHSCVPYRDGTRDTPSTYVPPPFRSVQMPPIATHKVDTAGLQLVTDWINAMP